MPPPRSLATLGTRVDRCGKVCFRTEPPPRSLATLGTRTRTWSLGTRIAAAMAKLTHKQIENALRKHALTYPESHEDFPWGERVVKVKGKVFVFMGKHEDEFVISVKLPQ